MSLELLSLLGAVLSILLVAFYRFLVRPYGTWRCRGLEGPAPWPAFGTWWGAWSTRQGEEDLRRVQTFGTIYGEFAGRTPVLVAADATVARAVLDHHANHFRSRRANCVRDTFLRQGLLALEGQTSNGPTDALVLPDVATRKVLPRILRCVKELTDSVKNGAQADGGRVLLSGLVSDFLAKVLVEAVLGQDESQEKGIDMKQFSAYLNQAFVNDNPDSPLSAIPFMYPSLSLLDKFVLRSEAAKYFTSLLLNKVQEKSNAEKSNKDHQHDLLDLLLEIQQATLKKELQEENKLEENSLQIKEFVFVQSLAILLNTPLIARTATTLGVAMLAAKPELQERLHSELYLKLDTADEFDLAHKSEFLDMFLAEVLRLHPIEYRLERECCESLDLEKVKIEKGMIVSIPVYALHRQPQLFKEPEDFNPERFSSDKKEKCDPFAYLPYGQAGNNAANISTQWNILVSKLALAALIKNFEFLPSEETELPPTFVPGVTGVPAVQPITVLVMNRK